MPWVEYVVRPPNRATHPTGLEAAASGAARRRHVDQGPPRPPPLVASVARTDSPDLGITHPTPELADVRLPEPKRWDLLAVTAPHFRRARRHPDRAAGPASADDRDRHRHLPAVGRARRPQAPPPQPHQSQRHVRATRSVIDPDRIQVVGLNAVGIVSEEDEHRSKTSEMTPVPACQAWPSFHSDRAVGVGLWRSCVSQPEGCSAPGYCGGCVCG